MTLAPQRFPSWYKYVCAGFSFLWLPGCGGGGSTLLLSPVPTISWVAVQPSASTVEVGRTRQFAALVQGKGNFNSTVHSLVNNVEGGDSILGVGGGVAIAGKWKARNAGHPHLAIRPTTGRVVCDLIHSSPKRRNFMSAHHQMTASPTPACTRHAFEQSSTQAPAEVREAARQGLQRFLNSIQPNELRQFNFSNSNELRKATLGGTPFRVFVLQPDNILHCSVDVPLIDLIEPLPRWLFPVISGGEYRTILTVEFIDNKWAAIGIGDSDLAKSFAEVTAKWPSSAGYRCLFVRNYQTLSEFIILIHSNTIKVDPLPTAVFSWGLREGKLLEPSEALTFLKSSLNRQLREQK